MIDDMAEVYLSRIEPREPLSGSSTLSKGKPIFEYAVDEHDRLANF